MFCITDSIIRTAAIFIKANKINIYCVVHIFTFASKEYVSPAAKIINEIEFV